jgi:hypothetical protein
LQGTLTLTATDDYAAGAGELEADGGAAAQPRTPLPRSCSYSGAFRHDRFHGFGVLRHASDAVYAGGWADGRRDGRGVVEWPDRAEELVGTWVGGVLCGPGVHSWYAHAAAIDDDVAVVGTEPHELHPPCQQQQHRLPRRQLLARYVGELAGGARHGYGEFHYADGGRYCGGWRWGRKHGAGVWVGADGRVTPGLWRDDVLVHACQGDDDRSGCSCCSGRQQQQHGAPSRGVASAPPVAAQQLRLPSLDAAVLGAPAIRGCTSGGHVTDEATAPSPSTAAADAVADVLLRCHPRLLALYRQTAHGGGSYCDGANAAGTSSPWPALPTDAAGVDALLAARLSELRVAAPTAAGAAPTSTTGTPSTAVCSLPRHVTLGEVHALLTHAGGAALSLGPGALPLTLPDVSDALLAVRTAEAQAVVGAACHGLAQGHRGCGGGGGGVNDDDGVAPADATTTRARHHQLASVVGSELRRLAAWRRAAHDPSSPVLYRELLQVLVRLAAVKGAAGALPEPTPVGDGAAADRRGSGDAGSVVGSVAGSAVLQHATTGRRHSSGGASLLSRCPSESDANLCTSAVTTTATQAAAGGGGGGTVRRSYSVGSVATEQLTQPPSASAMHELSGPPTAGAQLPPPPSLAACVDRYLRGLMGALRAPVKPPVVAAATPAALRQRRLSLSKQPTPAVTAAAGLDDAAAATEAQATAAAAPPLRDNSDDQLLARGGAALRAHAAAAAAAAARAATTGPTTLAAVLNTAVPGRFVATSAPTLTLTGSAEAWTRGTATAAEEAGAGDAAATAAASRALSAVLAETASALVRASPSAVPCPLPLLVAELVADGLLVQPLTGAGDVRLAEAAAPSVGECPGGAQLGGGVADGRPPSQAGAPPVKSAAIAKAKPAAATGTAASATAAAAAAVEQRQQQLAAVVATTITPSYRAASALLAGCRQSTTALLVRAPLLDTSLVVDALAAAATASTGAAAVAAASTEPRSDGGDGSLSAPGAIAPVTDRAWPVVPPFDGARLTHAEATALLAALVTARQQRRAAAAAFAADVQQSLAGAASTASVESCAADAAAFLASDGGAPLLEAAVAAVAAADAAVAPPPPSAASTTSSAAKKAPQPAAAAGKQAAPPQLSSSSAAQQQPPSAAAAGDAAAAAVLRDSVAAAAQAALVEAALAEVSRQQALLTAAVALVQGCSN